MAPVRFSCTTETKERLLIVHLKGYFDDEGGAELKRIVSATPLKGLKGVVFDFAQCLHANSSGISFLVDVVISLGEDGQLEVGLCAMTPLLGEAFRMVGLSRLARVFSGVDEAVRGLQE